MALEFELHLDSPRDLFVFRPDGHDPFDPSALGESGVDYMVAHTPAGLISAPEIKTTIYVSPETYDAGLEEKLRTAVQRYFRSELDDNRQVRRHFFRDSLVFLVIALAIVIIGLALQTKLGLLRGVIDPEIRTALSTGIDVLIWVALWTPVSAYVLDWYPFYQKERVYRALMNMELSVKPERCGEAR